MMAASVPNAPKQSPFTLYHTAYASSLPNYCIHLPMILHHNQLVCSVTAAFNKCISSFLNLSAKTRVALEFPFTMHNLASKIVKRELCLCVFVICSVFFCFLSFCYYLISTINLCLISIFAKNALQTPCMCKKQSQGVMNYENSCNIVLVFLPTQWQWKYHVVKQ